MPSNHVVDDDDLEMHLTSTLTHLTSILTSLYITTLQCKHLRTKNPLKRYTHPHTLTHPLFVMDSQQTVTPVTFISTDVTSLIQPAGSSNEPPTKKVCTDEVTQETVVEEWTGKDQLSGVFIIF